jgi:hypothetical protein
VCVYVRERERERSWQPRKRSRSGRAAGLALHWVLVLVPGAPTTTLYPFLKVKSGRRVSHSGVALWPCGRGPLLHEFPLWFSTAFLTFSTFGHGSGLGRAGICALRVFLCSCTQSSGKALYKVLGMQRSYLLLSWSL